MLRDHLVTMARYEAWATERLLQAVEQVPEPDYRRPMGLFFHSSHGTLNHLLVAGEGLWFPRFARGEAPRLSLSAELEADRARLADRLRAAARAWAPWVAGRTDAELAGRIVYARSDGVTMDLPYAATLAHVFNHGTHHRGQVTAAMTSLAFPAPEIDLVWMLREDEA
jgi:uncharacterized damage-inducible protein DinB